MNGLICSQMNAFSSYMTKFSKQKVILQCMGITNVLRAQQD